MTDKRLDSVINEIGYEIFEAVKSKDSVKTNFIDKALGVLMNDGVYAYFVYCKANNDKNNDKTKIFIKKLERLKKYMYISDVKNLDEKFFNRLSENLEQLLFFKEILEKILIYSRYHTKALSGD